MNEYLVKVFKKDRDPLASPEITTIRDFMGEKELFDWMEENRGELFTIYKAECILDYS